MTTYTPLFCTTRLPEERPWDAGDCSASSPPVIPRAYPPDYFERATDEPLGDSWTVSPDTLVIVPDAPVILRVLRCGLFPLAGVPDGPHRADVGDLIHVAAGDVFDLLMGEMAEIYE